MASLFVASARAPLAAASRRAAPHRSLRAGARAVRCMAAAGASSGAARRGACHACQAARLRACVRAGVDVAARSPAARDAPADDLMLDKCTPLGKRVLFVADVAEEKTAGGILLPSSANQRTGGFITGEVVAVGDSVGAVTAGAKVMVSGYGGAEVDFQGRKAKFVNDADILAILS
jgi:chaperonin GroES